MKILFVAVFSETSTNYPQAIAFEELGVDVVRYEYRIRAEQIGSRARDQEIIDLCKAESPDLVLFAKGSEIDFRVFEECTQKTTTGLWFSDALLHYESRLPCYMKDEMKIKSSLVSFFCCDKYNVFNSAKNINSNSFLNCEGFNSKLNYPIDMKRDLSISFIGGVSNHPDFQYRKEILSAINPPVKIFDNVYGADHSEVVGRSKININICTDGDSSDRAYKILAAKGLLFSDDWNGRIEACNFIDGKDLVVFSSTDDLNEKINYYLHNDEEADIIRNNGLKKVQEFTVDAWANRILEKTKELS